MAMATGVAMAMGVAMDRKMLTHEKDLKACYRLCNQGDRANVASRINISNGLLVDGLLEFGVINTIEAEAIRGNPELTTDTQRAGVLLDLLVQKDDLYCYRRFRDALRETGHHSLCDDMIRCYWYYESLIKQLDAERQDRIESLIEMDIFANNKEIEFVRNQESLCGKTRYQSSRFASEHEMMKNIEWLSQQPKAVIPVDLKLVKPGAGLLDTLRDQLRYVDDQGLLTIEWLLQVAPQQIVLVLMGQWYHGTGSLQLQREIKTKYSNITKVYTQPNYNIPLRFMD